DYLKARTIALAAAAFWGYNRFEDVILFAESLGMKRSDWLDWILVAMEKSTGPIRQFVDDFLRQTRDELFETREACIDFYNQDENFERLKRGEVGENLIHCSRAIANFRLWPHICELAMEASRGLILQLPEGSSIPDFDEFWHSLKTFISL